MDAVIESWMQSGQWDEIELGYQRLYHILAGHAESIPSIIRSNTSFSPCVLTKKACSLSGWSWKQRLSLQIGSSGKSVFDLLRLLKDCPDARHDCTFALLKVLTLVFFFFPFSSYWLLALRSTCLSGGRQ